MKNKRWELGDKTEATGTNHLYYMRNGNMNETMAIIFSSYGIDERKLYLYRDGRLVSICRGVPKYIIEKIKVNCKLEREGV